MTGASTDPVLHCIERCSDILFTAASYRRGGMDEEMKYT